MSLSQCIADIEKILREIRQDNEAWQKKICTFGGIMKVVEQRGLIDLPLNKQGDD